MATLDSLDSLLNHLKNLISITSLVSSLIRSFQNEEFGSLGILTLHSQDSDLDDLRNFGEPLDKVPVKFANMY